MPDFVVTYEDGTEKRYTPEEWGELMLRGLIRIIKEELEKESDE